ncbi:MAG: TetM/TetW/TetO/TetS family tetracycline resistance ribosomal protection protein [Atopobiaceae bacterium]|nr:TetM/TetW/TetO/TetS family tetracycline resistance ribosomal protection protein [Atopobiaceae bacterium]
MRQAVVGILAHVDAGKTTLAEALLYHAGVIRVRGRVDHGDSHLDTDAMERSRGITIFSSQAVLEHNDVRITLVDAPGHVDFSAEAERTLQVLDYAILMVSANDGVTGHTKTLWRLLERYGVPTVIFVNKMDLAHVEQTELMADLATRLSDGCVDYSDDQAETLHEAAASTDEAALDEYLDQGFIAQETFARLVSGRHVFPVFFGSALRDEGVEAFLDGMCSLVADHVWPNEFAARAYKVAYERGERITWLKVTGGALHARDLLQGSDQSGPWADKVNQIRIYQGAKYEVVSEVRAGQVCAVTGLSHVRPGDVLGAEMPGCQPVLAPVLTYRVEPGELDVHTVYQALRQLCDEDPMLGVTWDADLEEIRVQLMGAVQLEVLRDRLTERLGAPVGFGVGSILYKETISAPVMGYGHFEPLRHYAEAHFRMEPLPAGSGVVYGTVCSTDDLDLNWQRLALGCAMERDHRGVLAGYPLTDVRITLVSGMAHLKHTEGGDFRQAAWRAIRQGLMTAREQGAAVLLEPWYRFSLEVPADKVGRALADVQRMGARFGVPEMRQEMAVLEGEVAASEVGDYALDVAAYTGGNGSFICEFLGYESCHDAERVMAEAAYEPEADLPHTPDSVLCSHGAGYTVKWYEAADHMHVADDPSRERPWRPADQAFFAKS